MSSVKTPNKRVERNRRPALPLDAGRLFESLVCAPPLLSAAVAHPLRSTHTDGVMIPRHPHFRKSRHYMPFPLLLVLLTYADPSAAELSATNVTAEQILKRMAETYATCKSYRDSGVVKRVIFEGNTSDNPTIAEKHFTTVFVRPDRFRFEYREKEEHRELRYIVWCNGNDVRS